MTKVDRLKGPNNLNLAFTWPEREKCSFIREAQCYRKCGKVDAEKYIFKKNCLQALSTLSVSEPDLRQDRKMGIVINVIVVKKYCILCDTL